MFSPFPRDPLIYLKNPGFFTIYDLLGWDWNPKNPMRNGEGVRGFLGFHQQSNMINEKNLVGGFNPFEKY